MLSARFNQAASCTRPAAAGIVQQGVVPRLQLAGCKAAQPITGLLSPLGCGIASTSDRCIRLVVSAAPSPDTEEARSPLDAPQEWEVPMPSKRPDIFPEFEKMTRVFPPKQLPGDPEMPDEESEEAAKRTTPGDPDPEQKPGEPPEIPEKPAEPGQEPEKKTDIPNMPE